MLEFLPDTNREMDNEHLCECGKRYATQAGLRQHQRRYCRGPVNVNDDRRCPHCGGEFASFAGVRQHMRTAHPVQYNEELQLEANPNRAGPWTVDDLRELAILELDSVGPVSNIGIAASINRTVDAVKYRRKQGAYQAVLQQIREERIQEAEQQRLARLAEPLPEPDLAAPEVEIEDAIVLPTTGAQPQDAIEQEEGPQIFAPEDDPVRVFLADLLAGDLQEDEREQILNICTPHPDTDRFDTWVESVMQPLRKTLRNRRGTVPDNTEGLSRRKRRAREFRRVQGLFKTDIKALATEIIEGTPPVTPDRMPSRQDVEQEYRQLFGEPSNADEAPILDKKPDGATIYSPIGREELTRALNALKSSAPGPDGVTVRVARGVRKEMLLVLFNGMLCLGHLPPVFRESRTVLIPKTDHDLHLVGNWRPITISSVFLRLCNRIVADRLARVTSLHHYQRGFTPIDGVFANLLTLETLIKSKRDLGREYSVLSLDLRKAFDTISSCSVVRALERFGLDQRSQRYIKANYSDVRTTMWMGGDRCGSIPVRRGVKQGDPMSPILFNLVLDELVTQLNQQSGLTIEGLNTACIAYADDLLLLANDRRQASRLLKRASDFFEARGLRLNPSKCAALSTGVVPAKKKTYVITRPLFYIHGTPVKQLSVQETFKYLGCRYAFNGGQSSFSMADLGEQLSRLMRAPLKPHQRFKILNTFLVPKYIYLLQSLNVSKRQLETANRRFRAAVRKILHLPAHITNSALHAAKRDGGLGLFDFVARIPSIIINRWERLGGVHVDLDRVLELSRHRIDRIRRLIGPNVARAIDARRMHAQGLEDSWCGNGIRQVGNHRACSAYLVDPPRYWSGRDFVRAVQLRLNVLPTVDLPTNTQQQRKCRAGCARNESVCHVLQKCPITHHRRIQRHDQVVHRLRRWAESKNIQVEVEPNIRDTDGALHKPDLIFVKGEEVVVSDVCVGWEGPNSLEFHYTNKRVKYSGEAFLEVVRRRYPDRRVRVLPFVIGARGAWCESNKLLWDAIRAPMSLARDCVHSVLVGGSMIHADFMRAVWRGRH